MRFTNIEKAHVDKWIELAVENCVKVLEVSVRMKNEERYILPQIDFSANTVTVLKLSGCNLEHPVNLNNTINFYSLKELSLRRVYVVEEMLHNLISLCPSIENLTLIYCLGLKKFQALKPLKYFCIFPTYGLFESVYVEGSSLRYLRYEHPNGRWGEIKVNACHNLKSIILKRCKHHWSMALWSQYKIPPSSHFDSIFLWSVGNGSYFKPFAQEFYID